MTEKAGRLWGFTPDNGALLWKIMFLEPDLVVCENRFTGEMAASFTCLSLRSGKEILRDFTLNTGDHATNPEDRMTGLETTRGNLFYIHGYQSDSPEHAGLWAVDPLKGCVTWARPEVAFVAHLEEGMLVYSAGSFAGFPERNYMLLDALRGEVIEVIGQDARRANALRAEAQDDAEMQNVLLPRSDQEREMAIGNDDSSNAGRSGSIVREYIEHHGILVSVSHEKSKRGKGFDAGIRAFCDGKLLYQDTLAEGTVVPCMNYFLLRGVTLYYIRNMNELIAVHL
ncbi:MAG: DUF4905 domain-containing protein [Chlorobium sp.]|nr:DUF4905 domain-containing protein [Chlorobium sp.]MCW8815537.1 DUF4905 domain-containing protein [Chlorobium sp.]MCW8819726.1 DUF4905 domain-containing protein [Ignavibacteriaceae bacterium]